MALSAGQVFVRVLKKLLDDPREWDVKDLPATVTREEVADLREGVEALYAVLNTDGKLEERVAAFTTVAVLYLSVNPGNAPKVLGAALDKGHIRSAAERAKQVIRDAGEDPKDYRPEAPTPIAPMPKESM